MYVCYPTVPSAFNHGSLLLTFMEHYSLEMYFMSGSIKEIKKFFFLCQITSCYWVNIDWLKWKNGFFKINFLTLRGYLQLSQQVGHEVYKGLWCKAFELGFCRHPVQKKTHNIQKSFKYFPSFFISSCFEQGLIISSAWLVLGNILTVNQ